MPPSQALSSPPPGDVFPPFQSILLQNPPPPEVLLNPAPTFFNDKMTVFLNIALPRSEGGGGGCVLKSPCVFIPLVRTRHDDHNYTHINDHDNICYTFMYFYYQDNILLSKV